MFRFIISKKYMNLMFSIKNNKNIQQLSRESGMTTSHLSNVMDEWQRENIIVKERKGREAEIKLTEKGKKLVELLRQYNNLKEEKCLKTDLSMTNEEKS